MPNLRLAIIAHVYYTDIVPEILACQNILPELAHLHVTAPDELAQSVRCALRNIENSTLHALPNRGRDIAPFLSVLGSGALDSYDAVLKIHTKRSPHLLDGNIRRKLLFQMLCGERNATLRALAAFNTPSTGMVGWRSCFRSAPACWMNNKERVREIAARMQFGPPLKLGFFEGSMFWFRPAALAPLRALNLEPSDFEPEAGQTDGALHHAVERCFSIAAWTSGHVVRDLRGKMLVGR